LEHFEQIWTNAEQLIKQSYNDPLNIIVKQIKDDLDDLISLQDQNDKIEAMGSILLHLCYLSDNLNINVYAALKNQVDELKANLYDPDSDT
jgi:hypothetical protein